MGWYERFFERWLGPLPGYDKEAIAKAVAEHRENWNTIKALGYVEAKDRALSHLYDKSAFEIINDRPGYEALGLPSQLEELFQVCPHFRARASEIEINARSVRILGENRRFDPSTKDAANKFYLIGQVLGEPKSGQLLLSVSDGLVYAISWRHRLSELEDGLPSIFHWILSQASDIEEDEDRDCGVDEHI